MKILHFSHFNTVQVPMYYRDMYRRAGHDSRLLTLYKHRGNIPEDICLNKKIFNPRWLQKYREYKQRQNEARIAEKGKTTAFSPPVSLITDIRDMVRSIGFQKYVKQYGLMDFDIYHLHGGVGYFSDSRWVKRLAEAGKVIICNYHGPDLRVRGVIPVVDEISTLNITNEYDLLKLHPGLEYIPIPYDCESIPVKKGFNNVLTILHTPSDPKAKGTHIIEQVLKKVAGERRFKYKILTGISHEQVLKEKAQADIAIEQVGNFGGTGYGVNSLETLSMNIPTITEFTPDYSDFLKGHPFVLANESSLYQKLIELIDNPGLLKKTAKKGRVWVQKEHGYDSVWKRFLGLLEKKNSETAERLMAK